VLAGWASATWGIPQLSEVNKKLRTVIVHAYQVRESWMITNEVKLMKYDKGLEDPKRFDDMIKRFKEEVQKTAPSLKLVVKRMKKTHPESNSGSEDQGSQAARGKNDGNQHKWMLEMERFRRTLSKIHDNILSVMKVKPQKIKVRSLWHVMCCPAITDSIQVALIDDGVDLCKLWQDTTQTTGLSYCPPDGIYEMPWHQSKNGHGTIMANMITWVNPWVSLDIMKIYDLNDCDSGGVSDGRAISARSAAKAIDGARIRKADIISMPWSIMKPARYRNNEPKQSLEEEDIDALYDAIQKARQANILMFCSATDDIRKVGSDSLPFCCAPDSIFRIGAASRDGQADSSIEDTKTISYFFPGKQVADVWDQPSADATSYYDGSSVSTALAAGLASLIMYCNNIVRVSHQPDQSALKSHDSQKLDRWAEELRHHENMRKAFDNIYEGDYKEKRFLPVWGLFGRTTDQIGNYMGDETIIKLHDMVRKLCGNIDT
jgi:hypothetical protein